MDWISAALVALSFVTAETAVVFAAKATNFWRMKVCWHWSSSSDAALMTAHSDINVVLAWRVLSIVEASEALA